MDRRPNRKNAEGPGAVDLANRAAHVLHSIDQMPNFFGNPVLDKAYKDALGHRVLMGADGSLVRMQRGPINRVEAFVPPPQAAQRVRQRVQARLYLALEAFSEDGVSAGFLLAPLSLDADQTILADTWKFVAGDFDKVHSYNVDGVIQVPWREGSVVGTRAAADLVERMPTHRAEDLGTLEKGVSPTFTSTVVSVREAYPAGRELGGMAHPFEGELAQGTSYKWPAAMPTWYLDLPTDQRVTATAPTFDPPFNGSEDLLALGSVSGMLQHEIETTTVLKRGTTGIPVMFASDVRTAELTYPVLYNWWANLDAVGTRTVTGSYPTSVNVGFKSAFVIDQDHYGLVTVEESLPGEFVGRWDATSPVDPNTGRAYAATAFVVGGNLYSVSCVYDDGPPTPSRLLRALVDGTWRTVADVTGETCRLTQATAKFYRVSEAVSLILAMARVGIDTPSARLVVVAATSQSLTTSELPAEAFSASPPGWRSPVAAYYAHEWSRMCVVEEVDHEGGR